MSWSDAWGHKVADKRRWHHMIRHLACGLRGNGADCLRYFFVHLRISESCHSTAFQSRRGMMMNHEILWYGISNKPNGCKYMQMVYLSTGFGIREPPAMKRAAAKKIRHESGQRWAIDWSENLRLAPRIGEFAGRKTCPRMSQIGILANKSYKQFYIILSEMLKSAGQKVGGTVSRVRTTVFSHTCIFIFTGVLKTEVSKMDSRYLEIFGVCFLFQVF